MAMDGKTIRLRASCNACNESKVRCSQRKPTCARCERNGAECIYGLSRRTHKDAPPISMPSSASQRPRGPSRSSSYDNSNGNGNGKSNSNHKNNNGNWRGLPYSKSGTATPSTSNSNTSPDRSAGAQDAGLFDDYMSPVGTQFMISAQQHHHQQQQNSHAAAAAAAAVSTPQFSLYTHTPAPTSGDQSHGGLHNLLDFSSLDATSSSGALDDPLSAVVTRFPTPGAEYSQHPWATTDMEAFWSRQMAMATGGSTAPTTATAPPSPPSFGMGLGGGGMPGTEYCTCHAGVTELLASMRGGAGDDRRLSPDAQLAKLKRCIASSEASMGCAHGREDAEPIHIMAVATLIGYVINEFEMLAVESRLRAAGRQSPSSAAAALAADLAMLGGGNEGADRAGSSSLSSGEDESMSGMVAHMANITPPGDGGLGMNLSMGGLKPRLSWGVLELEDDDEVDLRQRLYLLSFRKLERLLAQLTHYLRGLHDARASLPDPSRHMAFVMACDYTRLWLEKKAEDVRRLFSVSMGDDTVDPSLV